ncbi:MAG TPA: RNA-binding protein [Aurantimonas sp.]
MPIGPQGQRRPADVIGGAIRVAKIATGEIEEKLTPKSGRTRSGHAGAKARVENTTADERSEIARKAANARWE